MPDPFEVHARSKWEWSGSQRGSANQGAISDQLADPAPAKPPPAKKDLWGRCKQAPDKKHHPVFVFRPPGFTTLTCRWSPRWYRREGQDAVAWQCHHREECEYCHKIFRYSGMLDAAECPDYPDCEEQKAAVIATYNQRIAEVTARKSTWEQRFAAQKEARSRRTSYRRPKAGKK